MSLANNDKNYLSHISRISISTLLLEVIMSSRVRDSNKKIQRHSPQKVTNTTMDESTGSRRIEDQPDEQKSNSRSSNQLTPAKKTLPSSSKSSKQPGSRRKERSVPTPTPLSTLPSSLPSYVDSPPPQTLSDTFADKVRSTSASRESPSQSSSTSQAGGFDGERNAARRNIPTGGHAIESDSTPLLALHTSIGLGPLDIAVLNRAMENMPTAQPSVSHGKQSVHSPVQESQASRHLHRRRNYGELTRNPLPFPTSYPFQLLRNKASNSSTNSPPTTVSGRASSASSVFTIRSSIFDSQFSDLIEYITDFIDDLSSKKSLNVESPSFTPTGLATAITTANTGSTISSRAASALPFTPRAATTPSGKAVDVIGLIFC